MPKYLFAVFTLILASLACNWTDVAPPAAPVIVPSPLPTFAISTLTPIPTETPLPTPTSTPDVPVAWPKDLGVNCRYGPGAEWEAVSSITSKTITEIKGRTVNTKWWYVVDPLHEGEFCWVAYDVVDTAGNLNIVSIVDAPIASVTTITLDVAVEFVACGSDNPVTADGFIMVNGPTEVTFQWTLDSDLYEIMLDDDVKFTEAGKQKVSMALDVPDCGEYTAKLVVTSPNPISAQKAFTIQAP